MLKAFKKEEHVCEKCRTREILMNEAINAMGSKENKKEPVYGVTMEEPTTSPGPDFLQLEEVAMDIRGAAVTYVEMVARLYMRLEEIHGPNLGFENTMGYDLLRCQLDAGSIGEYMLDNSGDSVKASLCGSSELIRLCNILAELIAKTM